MRITLTEIEAVAVTQGLRILTELMFASLVEEIKAKKNKPTSKALIDEKEGYVACLEMTTLVIARIDEQIINKDVKTATTEMMAGIEELKALMYKMYEKLETDETANRN